MANAWHLAQLNVATVRYPLDDPRMADFVDQLDAVNALAERSPGVVWRLQGDDGNATDVRVEGEPDMIVNMSVWQSVDALADFAYRSAHRLVVADRRRWFERPDGVYQVLWWVPAGHEPTVAEALDRLGDLESSGPSPRAFSFRRRFPPPPANDGIDATAQ